ncbi:MAG: hypothetical protein MK135_12830, partial [Polyangiaceae bacterium]|nr:hypothetical protein [Polyangiaceae bacterium]
TRQVIAHQIKAPDWSEAQRGELFDILISTELKYQIDENFFPTQKTLQLYLEADDNLLRERAQLLYLRRLTQFDEASLFWESVSAAEAQRLALQLSQGVSVGTAELVLSLLEAGSVNSPSLLLALPGFPQVHGGEASTISARLVNLLSRFRGSDRDRILDGILMQEKPWTFLESAELQPLDLWKLVGQPSLREAQLSQSLNPLTPVAPIDFWGSEQVAWRNAFHQLASSSPQLSGPRKKVNSWLDTVSVQSSSRFLAREQFVVQLAQLPTLGRDELVKAFLRSGYWPVRLQAIARLQSQVAAERRVQQLLRYCKIFDPDERVRLFCGLDKASHLEREQRRLIVENAPQGGARPARQKVSLLFFMNSQGELVATTTDRRGIAWVPSSTFFFLSNTEWLH